VIETEEQRRWWFATHPEYSRSRRWIRGNSERENDGKIDPEEVDRYVEEALKYETGAVADLLKSVKRNFGTEGDSRKRLGDLRASTDTAQNDLVRLASFQQDAGLAVHRMPTLEEISRLPRELIREFFRRLDAILQNNPLIIDPNALERHHGLPREFVNYFLDCGLRIDDFIIIMRLADHRLKPDGLHTGKGKGGDWNREWKEFIDKHPPENTLEHQERIRNKLNEMVKKYGIDKKSVLSPTGPKQR
jgi:Predicted lipoprotein of unknown function (DUF2380)